MEEPIRLLLVESGEPEARWLAGHLPQACVVDRARNSAEAVARLARGGIDLVLLDLPPDSGLEAAACLRLEAPEVPVLLVTSREDEAFTVQAVRLGVLDVLPRPRVDAPSLRRGIRQALERGRILRLLEENRRLVQSVLDAVGSCIAVLDQHGHVLSVNSAWLRPPAPNPFVGSGAGVGTDYSAVCQADPELAEGLRRVLQGEEAAFSIEYLVDDEVFNARITRFTGPGQARAVVAHERVTARKRLEEQLRHSQKMEAVGRLAGGIAHDFNNLLTAIAGYGQLLQTGLRKDDPLLRDVEEIRKAADRAVALTRQLLAFSRKQFLQPKVINLNRVIAEIERMLRRVIGEDIELRTVLDPALMNVRADRSQIEQVLMNLAVNASDAMPQGGRLTLSTANADLDELYCSTREEVKPGRYASLEVSDTGCGMGAEVLSHLFEPFFTTKERGKGTGLGLCTVYGIVKQSGGHIEVQSAPGRGSTFRIFLPAVDAQVDTAPPTPPPPRIHGGETILLVEDEPAVRRLMREVLARNGYSILEAGDGVEALEVCNSHGGPIHLVITDVVMPRMNGRELVEQLALLRPDAKVMYVSGYPESGVHRRGVLMSGTRMLSKPFKAEVLAQKVREALDSQTP